MSNDRPLAAALGRCRQPLLWIAAFSLLINILMLTSSLYMMQVFDRVLASGSLATLAFLTLAAAGALALMSGLDFIRSRILGQLGEWLERRLRVAEAECAEAVRQPVRCCRRADVPHHVLDPHRQPSDLGDRAGDLIRVIWEPEPTDARPTPVRADRQTEALIGASIGTFRRLDEELRILGEGDQRRRNARNRHPGGYLRRSPSADASP